MIPCGLEAQESGLKHLEGRELCLEVIKMFHRDHMLKGGYSKRFQAVHNLGLFCFMGFDCFLEVIRALPLKLKGLENVYWGSSGIFTLWN